MVRILVLWAEVDCPRPCWLWYKVWVVFILKHLEGFKQEKKLIGSSSNVALTAGALNSSGSERDMKKC